MSRYIILMKSNIGAREYMNILIAVFSQDLVASYISTLPLTTHSTHAYKLRWAHGPLVHWAKGFLNVIVLRACTMIEKACLLLALHVI
jgi:hypothetical protein